MKNTVSLRKNIDFLKVYNNGKFYVGKFIVMYSFKNTLDENRLGVVISKKVGKSVKRNRIRRLIKENYKMYEVILKSNYDIIIVSRKNNNMPDFNNIKKEMMYLIKKLGLLRD